MNPGSEMGKVLVVDDEPSILSSIKDLLEDDFDVQTCLSAELALEALEDNHVAAILSDQRMPGMSGDEFLARAQTLSCATRILITGYADLDAVVSAVNRGQIYAYVSKPWDPNQLKVMVDRAVEHYELLEDLQHEKNLLHTLMNSTTDGIFFKDCERRFTRVNHCIAEILGADSSENLVGKHTREVGHISSEILERTDSEEKNILETAESVRDQVELVKLTNGTHRWYSLSKSALKSAKGGVEGLVGIARDVTDRHLAEQALKESEAKFRDFANIGTDWLWEMDADLRFSWFSDQVERILGISKMSLLGKRRAETLVDGVNEDLLKQHVADLEAHRPFRNFEQVRRREDNGELMWISVNGKPYFDEGGKFLGYRGVGTNITERKRAEAQIEALARFHSENPNPNMRISKDGFIQEANKASEPLLKFWNTKESGKAPAAIVSMVEELLTNDVAQQLEVEGEDQIIHLNLVPVAELDYVNVYGEDVTVQRKTEQKLRTMQKMEAIGQLTGGVAHDFNNRLTVILGNLELLEDKLGEDQKSLKLVQSARRAAEGGAKLTRQLLTFSRRQMLEQEIVDVNALLRNLEELVSRTLRETVEVGFRLEPGLWTVETDAGQLEDAIINLSVNARDAMPSGGQLIIETANVDLSGTAMPQKDYMLPGEYVLVAVTDTGEGIPKDVQERIFEPFFSTKETGKGTGLGMAMVYGFAKQSKGYVNIYSEVGRGTCIKLYLPRSEAPLPTGDLPATGAMRDEVQAAKSVLVVEDDPDVRNIAVRLLADLGLRVIKAENAVQALEIVEHGEEFDLLFTDMIMPGGLSGLELAKTIRTQRPSTIVIYTSGYTENGPISGDDDGAPVHWLTKPYTRETLARKVRDALGS